MVGVDRLAFDRGVQVPSGEKPTTTVDHCHAQFRHHSQAPEHHMQQLVGHDIGRVGLVAIQRDRQYSLAIAIRTTSSELP